MSDETLGGDIVSDLKNTIWRLEIEIEKIRAKNEQLSRDLAHQKEMLKVAMDAVGEGQPLGPVIGAFAIMAQSKAIGEAVMWLRRAETCIDPPSSYMKDALDFIRLALGVLNPLNH